MLPFRFPRWIKSALKPRVRPIVNKPRIQLHLESLEERIVPIVYTWTGAAGTAFSNPLNWGPGGAPIAGAPVQLQFQSPGTTSFTANQDIPGLVVDQINFSSGSFTITGSQTMRIANSSTAIVVNGASAPAQVISANLQFGVGSPSTNTITIQPGGTLTLSGQITGDSNAQLVKEGVGTLTLSGDNRFFSGPFTISSSIGNGGVVLTNATGLGGAKTSNLQTFSISGALAGTTRFTFQYPDNVTNPATAPITFTGTSVDTGTIQSALTALFNGLGFSGTPVRVTLMASGPGSATYALDFTGTAAGVSLLQLNPAVTVAPGSASTSTLVTGGDPNFTTINPNTQLIVNVPNTTNPSADIVNNPLIVSGAGVDNFSGAIQRTVVGTSTLAGDIRMNANTTFGSITSSTLNITGGITDAGNFTVTKEGPGGMMLDPRAPISAANNFHGGNTYEGNTIVNNGLLQIAHPYALGIGGQRVFVNTSTLGAATLATSFTNNPTIPTTLLNFAQVQTISFVGATPGVTRFTLRYNGVSTPAITYNGNTTDAANIQSALNALATISGIAANVTVVQVGSAFHVTFGGSLGGMEIPLLGGTVVSQFGTGAINIGVTSGSTPIGFRVPDQYVSIVNPGAQSFTTVVARINITSGGSGYTSPPTVTISGANGVGATAVATVIGGVVTAVTVTSGGTGFTGTPSVVFSGGGATTQATGSAVTQTLSRAPFFNMFGHNSWLQPITNQSGSAPTYLGSPAAITWANVLTVSIGSGTNFTVDGILSGQSLLKQDLGRLILTAANALTGTTTFLSATGQGAINIRDSQALGTGATIVTVTSGNSLELQADGIPDSDGRAGTFNLYITRNISVGGAGANNTGALSNISGINRIVSNVSLTTNIAGATIGVAPDPDPLNVQLTPWNNFSQLTIDGVVSGGALTKTGFGELVLTNANTYSAGGGQNSYQTFINQGWITAQNNRALGANAGINNPVLRAGVRVLSGAALVLRQDLTNNYLSLPYNMSLAGMGITHRFSWLNQGGALLNLDGTNTITGDIYLEGTAGIGVELDGGIPVPYPRPSELTLTGTIRNGTTTLVPGQILKLGSQRLIIEGAGTYTGGVDIRSGVILINNDTALGLGTTNQNTTTIVRNGAALELGSTSVTAGGGVQRGLQVWYNNLILNGAGNSLFGDAPLMVQQNDNIWRGPITLNSNIAITFKGPAANRAIPEIITTVNSLTGTVDAVVSTPGSSSINAVQTIEFGGTFVPGDTFTLVVSNGTNVQQTAPIAWSANVNVLMANIQNALNAPAMQALFTLGLSFAEVALLHPVVEIFPNARLISTGIIDDGPNPTSLTIDGGGEMNLAGANDYRGTTYVKHGILTIQNAKSLGEGAISQVQTISFSAATPGTTQFTLNFNGFTTPLLTYDDTSLSVAQIQNAVNALNSVGPLGGQIAVVANFSDSANPVFTFTLGGALSGSEQPLITTPTVIGGTTTLEILTTGTGGTIVSDGAQLQLQGGITVTNEPITLAGDGNPLQNEVQRVTVSSPEYGSFQLSFTNPNPVALTSTTPSIPSGASAAEVQAALNALASIQAGDGNGGGSVYVTRDGWNTYTVLFQGSFLGASQPWSKQVVSVTGTSGAFTLNFNGYQPTANVMIGATPAATLASLQSALNTILADLDSPGGGTGTATVALTPAGKFQITFGGSLAGVAVPLLQTSNVLGVPVPTVNVVNEAWLVSTVAQQVVSTSGTSGSFNLNFAGFAPQATVSLGATPAATLATLQTALNTLLTNPASPGGGTGTAIVELTATNNFRITFGGSLFGVPNVPILVASNFSGGAGAGITTTGATSGVAEVIQGGTANATPTTWFNSGPAPVANAAVNLVAPTSGQNNISGPITSVTVDPGDQNIIYITTPGGGAWKTYNAGAPVVTWEPLFDGISTVETWTVGGVNPQNDNYALTYTDPFTGNRYTTPPMPFDASAQRIQDALNGVVGLGNSVTVRQTTRTNAVNAQQSLTINKSTSTWTPSTIDPVRYTRFRLAFNAVTTGFITYTGNALQDAVNIQNALNATGVLPPGGYVNVRVLSSAPDESFEITFLGTLAGSAQPLITFLVGGPGGDFWSPLAPPSPFPTINGIPAVGTSDSGSLTQITAGVQASYTNTVTFGGGRLANRSVPPLAYVTTGVTTIGTGVSSISVRSGSGYTAPTVVFSSVGAGTGAAGIALGAVSGTSLVSGGSGYASAPSVTFTGGSGSGATGVATINGAGQVTGVTITNPGNGYTSAPTIVFSGGGGTGAAFNSSLSITSIVITNPGTGYVNAPNVVITDPVAAASGTASGIAHVAGGQVRDVIVTQNPLGSGATANAVLTGTRVNIVNMVSQGSGYTSPPLVQFVGGGGTGASATATVNTAGAVTGITVTNNGTGYTSAPTVLITPAFDAPPAVAFVGGGGTLATATTTINGVMSLGRVTNVGVGYFDNPTVTVSRGDGGVGATAASIVGVYVRRINMTAGGANYTANFNVTVTSPTGANATGVANVAGGVVTSVTITNGGRGFDWYNRPTINLNGGGGTGATGDVILEGGVFDIIPSRNYSPTPTVTITGGGATTPAVIAPILSITKINVGSGGTGYVSSDAAVLAATPVTITGGGGTGATAVAYVDNNKYVPNGTPDVGKIVSIAVTNGGSGYTSIPTFTFGGTGTGASVASVTFSITGYQVISPGAGYTSEPTILITDPTGVGATAVATINRATGQLVSVSPASGLDYKSAPFVTITAGPANNVDMDPTAAVVRLTTAADAATAASSIRGVVTNINVVQPGIEFTSQPTVNIGSGLPVTALPYRQTPYVQRGINSQIAMTGNAIAVDPNNHGVIYFATGDGNNEFDSYYGSGVYRSTDFGKTWNLLSDPTLPAFPAGAEAGNPLYGFAINEILLDSPNNMLYVAASDRATNGLQGASPSNAPYDRNPGIWRFDLIRRTWFNLTDLASTKRVTGLPAPPGSPGPDDQFSIAFPQQNISWTDLALIGGNLHASLGTSTGAAVNGVYHITNPTNADNSNNPPTWFVGIPSSSPTTDFPVFPIPDNRLHNFPFTALNGNIRMTNVGTTLYAAITNSSTALPGPHQFLQVLQSTDQGLTWTQVSPQPSNYMANNGFYASAIAANAGNVFVAGTDAGARNFVQQIALGGAVTDISVDAVNAGPHTDVHSLVMVGNNLLAATDGGLWRYDTVALRWANLTGNLSIGQLTSLASHPTDPNTLFAAGRGISISKYVGTQTWQQSMGIPSTLNFNADLNGDKVVIDPNNANVMYAIQRGSPPPAPNATSARLFFSTNGGLNWTSSVTQPTRTGAVVVDKLSRAFVAAGQLLVSTTPLSPSFSAVPGAPTNSIGIAVAELQGAFRFDPRFPAVTDLGATSPDSRTIYVTDGTSIRLTKDFGLTTWALATAIPLGTTGSITKIIVDPRNRDTVYAVTQGRVGSTETGAVWKSIDAGQSWTNISAGLPSSRGLIGGIVTNGGSGYTSAPTVTITGGGGTGATAVASISKGVVTGITITNPGTGYTTAPAIALSAPPSGTAAAVSPMFANIPVWDIVIDPRTDLLYVGTENGVYQYANGITRAWVPFGDGMPQVSVHALDLNLTTNILTAGTYGRGAYQFFIDTPTVESGALYAPGGANFWNGPIILAAPTTISAGGDQDLQNGTAVTQLTIQGTISDQTYAAKVNGANTLVKIGGGDLTLTGANIYGGETVVKNGNLIAQNLSALGASGIPGKQELFINNATRNSTELTFTYTNPLTSVTSTSAAIIYTGIAATDAANIQSALNASSMTSIFGPGPGAAASVTVVANDEDSFLITFNGSLAGIAGPMIIANVTAGTGSAYAATSGGTVIEAGSILQLKNSLTGEPLFLFGNGVMNNGHWSGALQNVSGNNVFTGSITIENNTTIGVDGTTQLTVTSPLSGTTPAIVDLGAPTPAFGITKEGTGTLTLASTNSYRGNTSVNRGVLNIQHSSALGAGGATTTIFDLAQLQLQQVSNGPVNVSNQNLVLSGTGITGTGAMVNVAGNNAWGSATNGILLNSVPGFAGTTMPSGAVSFNVMNAADTLALNGNITEPTSQTQGVSAPQMTLASGISKIGPGTLALAGNNAYSGSTFVNSGVIEVRSSGALGANKGQTIQRITTHNPGGTSTFSLNFNNAATGTGPLPFGASAGEVQTALNNISTIGRGVQVSRERIFSGVNEVQTLTFQNARTTQGALTGLTVSAPAAGGAFVAGTYSWVVSAVLADGESTASAEVTQTLAANQQTTLSWSPVANALSYRVYRTTTSGIYTAANFVSSVTGATSYVDTGVAAPNQAVPTTAPTLGTLAAGTYYYVITSVKANSESAVSNERAINVNGTDAVNLSWGAVSGATSYRIYRTQASGLYSSTSLIATTATPTFQDTGLALTAGTPPLSSAPLLQTRFRLSFGASTTAAPGITLTGVPATDALAIQNALTALPAILPGNLIVTADPTDTVFTITFTGNLQTSLQPLLVSAINSGPGASTVAETVAGSGGVTYVYTVVFGSAALAGPQPLLVATPSNSQMTVNVSQVAQGNGSAIVANGATLQFNGAAGNVSSPTGAPTQNQPSPGAGGAFTVSDDYFYIITAVTPSGESIASNQQKVAVLAGQQVNLSWLTVPGATGYKIYRSTDSGNYGKTSLVGIVDSGAATTFTDNGRAPVLNALTSNTGGTMAAGTYFYIVRAFDASGERAASNEQPITLAAGRRVDLSWSAVTGATGYRIYRSTLSGGHGASSLVMTINSGATTTYQDNGSTTLSAPTLAAGTGLAAGTYYYVVAAVNATGETLASNERPLTLNAPSNVALGWTAVTGATSYRIYRTTTAGFYASSLVGTVVGTTFTDTGIVPAAGTPVTGAPMLSTFAPIYTALLNGAGVGGRGALANVAGNNTFSGNVILQTNSSIGASPASTLNVTGVVEDPIPAPIPPASIQPPALTKVGTGTVVFTNNNAYTGNTFINEGVLNIQHSFALGINTSAVQTVSVSGAPGSFQLGFDGYPGLLTTPLVLPFTKSDLQNALNTLLANPAAPGGGNGLVTVELESNGFTYDVTFGGSLANIHVPLLVSSNITPTVSATVNMVLAGGASRAVVANAATLQTQSATGFTEASGKILSITGQGFNGAGALQNISGNNTWGTTQVVLAGSSAIGSDANTLFITQPITDNFQTQTIQFNGFNAGDAYRLVFDGFATTPQTYSSSTATNAATLQSALQNLLSVSLYGGTVSVVHVSGTMYLVSLTGPMAGRIWPAITASTLVGSGTFTLGTPTQVTNAYAVDKVGAGTVQYAGSTANAYTGLTTVVNGALELNKATADTAILGNLTVGDATGAAGSARARLLGNSQIVNSSNVIVRSDGLFELNFLTETINTLDVNAGTVTTGTSTSPASSATAGGSLTASSVTLSNAANLNLTGSGAVVTVNGPLTITDSTVTMSGASSHVDVNGLTTMTGGLVNLVHAGSQLKLGGNLTATSDLTTGASTISGTGTLSLNGATRTFTVNHGVTATVTSDLVVNAVISGIGSEGINKTGAGRLELNAVNSYTGVTNILNGDVQVDTGASINNVTLTGGSLSGKGMVGAVASGSGTVNPGYNATAANTGILSTGAIVWGSSNTFFVDLTNGSAPGSPVPGIDYDRLNVAGNVTLGNAILTGTAATNIAINDTFTIIQTTGGTISGRLDAFIASTRVTLQQGDAVFIGGKKFTIDYGDNTKVVLKRVFNTATVTITSSVTSPSVYGQSVVFTATVVPEIGAGELPVGSQVTFTMDSTTTLPTLPSSAFQQTFTITSSGTLTFAPQFNPQTQFSLWNPGGTHTIDAVFTDGSLTFATAIAPQVSHTVNEAPVSIAVSSSPNVTASTPVFGQAVTITAQVTSAVAQLAGAQKPSSTVTFILDSGSPVTVLLNASTGIAQWTIPSSMLSVGPHTVHVTYNEPDAFYVGSTTPTDFSLPIQKDNVVVAFTPAPAPIPLGQMATFNVTVSAATSGSIGVPQGTVTFYDGSTLNPALGSAPVVSGAATFNTSNFTFAGTHTIFAVFTPNNNNYNPGQQSTPFVVNKATTQTVITSTVPSNPTFGQQVTFNVTVSRNPIIDLSYGMPTGTVTIWDGPAGTGVNLGTGAVDSTTGIAVILTTSSGLSTGTHTINAVYSGDATFATSTGTNPSFVVNPAATTTTLTASPLNTAAYGSVVRLNAQVRPVVLTLPNPPAGTHVAFYDGPVSPANLLGTSAVDAAGNAILDVTTLKAGIHSLNAVFIDDNDGFVNYATSTGTLSGYQITNAPTTTVVTTNPLVPSGTGVFGQPITFQATVTSVGGNVGAGIVTFRDGATVLGTQLVNTSGIAVITVNTLTAGNHNITATYVDNADPFFASSVGALNPYAVIAANTQILPTDFTTSVPVSALGSPVTFTARVTTQNPSTATVTTGSVTFWDGAVGSGINLGTANVNTSGVATLTTSVLVIGPHTINAVFNGGAPNFNASLPTSLTQIVRRATAITFNPIGPPSNFFGLSLSYLVSIDPSTAPATPTGTITVSEIVGSSVTPLVSFPGYLGGPVTMPPISGLAAGNHTLMLNYSGDLVFAPSSKTITQVIAPAVTSTTLDTLQSFAPVFYGETVTFTATVTNTTAPDPAVGTVTFRDTYNGVTTILLIVPLSGSNVAQFTTTATALKGGNHSITATFTNTGNPDYANSVSLARTQTVKAATTLTTVSPLSAILVGNGVTLTATVTPTSLGTPGNPPSGTVTFRKTLGTTTTVLGTVAVNASGVATFNAPASAFGVTTYTITAKYNGSSPNYAASAVSAGVPLEVQKANVGITITPSAASGTSTYGKTVTFTALVAVTSGGTPGTPTGTVRFWDGAVGGTLLKTVTLVTVNSTTAKAVFKTTATQLSAGSHNIVAEYLGDSKHAATQHAITYTVNQAATSTTFTSSPLYWPVGPMVTTFTATVKATSGGSPGVPTGTVTFTVDGFAQSPVPVVNGKATMPWTFASTGNHTVSAAYTPSTSPVQNFAASAAANQTQNVQMATSINFTSTSTTTGVKIKATVTTPVVGGPPLTGTVTFMKNGIILGVVTLNANGTVPVKFLALGTGTHTITAVYSGDANYNPATITKSIAGKLVGRLV